MVIFFSPSRTFVMPTCLPPEEAFLRLAEALAPTLPNWEPRWHVTRDHKNRDLHFSRIISFSDRNRFILPYASAVSRAAPHGADVTVSVRMRGASSAFMTIWIGFAALLNVLWLGSVAFGNAEPSLFMFIPFVLLVFGLAITWGFFHVEAEEIESACRSALPAPTVVDGAGPFR